MTRLPDAALDDLRARNPVAGVAERLGVTLRRSGRVLVGACPVCGGGRSAQRFEVKRDDAWVCAVCQDGGDVIRLVERATGLGFRDAVDWLGGAGPMDAEAEARVARERADKQAKRDAESDRYRQKERRALYRMWQEAGAIGNTPVAYYLAGRGLWPHGLRVRHARAVPYFHGEETDERGRRVPRKVFEGPAMLAPIIGPAGQFAGLHITWLALDGDGKAVVADPDTGEVLPAKKVRGSGKGGRIEVIARADARRIVLGEGIETVLAAADLEDRRADTAYWSALSLGNLGGPALTTVPHPVLKHRNGHAQRIPGPEPDFDAPALALPAGIGELVLLGDGDSERVLTETSLRRATLRYAKRGRVIRVAWAPEGQDFNDLLRADRAAEMGCNA